MRRVLIVLALFVFASAAAARPPNHAATVKHFSDCSHCPEMTIIPNGSFTMGTAPEDPAHDILESPLHEVQVKQFAAGIFDVTRAEWAYFARVTRRPVAAGCQWTGKPGREGEKSSSWQDLGFPQTPLDPVVCVTWGDAKAYTEWLSHRSGKSYRLLTEAEWEYAARAGTVTPFWWGEMDASHDHANHGTEQCCGGLIAGRDVWIKTSPGNAFPPNPFGLYDMSGNVLQWVEDCFSPTYAGLPSDGTANLTAATMAGTGDLADFAGLSTCDYRVVRGGDWGDQARWIRSASRSFAPPPGPESSLADYRSGGVGFRVARDMP